ncbi:MAG: anaerobic ribonucleoside triphosphate reductase, partial [Oscillospiraceae bacterium]|nr:anaerobic ribonucleoside triphosphate reductase [Oscillospiraceae bacterium]
MISTVLKRDGREVEFDGQKITDVIDKARRAVGHRDYETAAELSGQVVARLEHIYEGRTPTVEEIQDVVERVLMDCGHAITAKEFILYRAERTRIREMNTRLMKIYEDITFKPANESDIKRENANIDGNTAMGMMLKYGSEGAKEFYGKFVLKPEHARAHREGDIHIHDLEFYTLTTTCCQIDIKKLFKGGFSTGHGHLREPNDIQSYAALACIAIQSNQNDQHGGQSIVNFDHGMRDGVVKTYQRLYQTNLHKSYELLSGEAADIRAIKAARARVYSETGLFPRLGDCGAYCAAEAELLEAAGLDADCLHRAQAYAVGKADEEIDRSTFQAMEAFIHNLNTMHSRAGAQTPFSSINYGMDTSPEGRLVIKNILLATEAGLGHGETAIFPIQIFRVKKGVNYDPGDPNYDLLKQAISVSAKRMYPNFAFQDAPYNIKYYKEGKPETEIAYMGCRTRVIGNTFDPGNEISNGRGNLSFTSINLPRIAIKANRNIEFFFDELERKLNLVADQLLERFEIQARKNVGNFPFLMGQGVWIGSERLRSGEELREVLKHGTLSIGYIGLAECLVALTGAHHAESADSRNLGIEIIGFMRRFADKASADHNMNFTLLATPAEGLSGRFVKIDREKYGAIAGVTDREYYTNGFHVPVHYEINAYDKIKIEAPYHELSNAGHITYVELDGDATQNLEAFERIIRAMFDAGIGYGSI